MNKLHTFSQNYVKAFFFKKPFPDLKMCFFVRVKIHYRAFILLETKLYAHKSVKQVLWCEKIGEKSTNSKLF